jgi:hypothetical protein
VLYVEPLIDGSRYGMCRRTGLSGKQRFPANWKSIVIMHPIRSPGSRSFGKALVHLGLLLLLPLLPPQAAGEPSLERHQACVVMLHGLWRSGLYEGEIALLVMAGQFAAVGFGLDLTRRELQSELKKKGLPWERAKAFEGAVLSGSRVLVSSSWTARD